ncbi:MAG TPA: hypothetical protein DEF51_46930, partial [Myxococcales bacterium]|nr:hypothetical protein [Myxococcales bacterium]
MFLGVPWDAGQMFTRTLDRVPWIGVALGHVTRTRMSEQLTDKQEAVLAVIERHWRAH